MQRTKWIYPFEVGNLLPDSVRSFHLEVRYYLSCYRAATDARHAIVNMSQNDISLALWKVQWAGICGIMKTSVHLMSVDAKRCFSPELRLVLKARYDELRRKKPEFQLFWNFIDRERHNILKEYEFSAYESYVADPENAEKDLGSILSLLSASKELRIRGGVYDGRLALELALEACDWIIGYLEETIRLGGFEPNDKIEWSGFLYRRVPAEELPAEIDWTTLLGSPAANKERGQGSGLEVHPASLGSVPTGSES